MCTLLLVDHSTHHIYTGMVAWSDPYSCGMQKAACSILMLGTFFHGDLAMKKFVWPFSYFLRFKKSSCQLLVKECVLSTGKPQCGLVN